MVARGISRHREIGIRLAIGASRRRIFRQLFTESLLLALLGSAAAVALSCTVLQATFTAIDAPAWLSIIPDWRVLSVAVALAVTAAVFFGFVPALQMSAQRHRKTLAGRVLIGAQLAGSCVLLIVSALLVRAVNHVLYTDPGFGYEQVLGINPGLDAHGWQPASARAYLNTLTSRVRKLPGVTSVALSRVPILKRGLTWYMTAEIGGRAVNIYPNWVDPEFFQTMNIRILRGRIFFPGEKNAVIVSESLARKQWPNQDPLGKPLWHDGASKDIIVGVARNARVKALNDGDAVEAYWPVRAEDMPAMTVVVKTAGAPEGIASKLKSVSEGVDPKLFPSIWLLKAGFHETAADVEKLAAMVTVLGIVAVSMAGIGIAGLVGYAVSQQKKEMAIRIALGATHVRLLAAILRQFSWPVVLGLLSGAGITAAASSALRRTLYGVSNLDPLSYIGGAAILLLVVTVAALAPARRILRINLSGTLRYE